MLSVIRLLRKKIAQIVDGMRDEIVDLTCELIKFSTISQTGSNYLEYTNFIYEKLKKAGLEVQKIDVPQEALESLWGKRLEKSLKYIEVKKFSPRVIVLGRWSGTLGKPSLHLNNHYDIYESRASFEPTVKEGRIFGEGASDPRAGTVSMVMAVEALRRAGVKLRGDLFVSQTPDCQLGGESGAGYLVDKGYGKSDMVIIGGPGGADTVTLGHKGALWFEITTFGKEAHAGECEGTNAIDKMFKIYEVLYKLDQDFTKKGIKSKWPISPSECNRPTIVTLAINAHSLGVPDKCVMYVDRRVNPEETIESAKEEILGEIRKLEKDDRDLKVEVRVIHAAENPVTSADSHLAKTIMKNIRATLEVEPKTVVWCYYSDFRFFPLGWKAQTVSYSPGIPRVYRGPGEYVPIQDLVSATKVLTLTIMDLIG